MAKRFTLAEAQALIPRVDRLRRTALERKTTYEETEGEIHTFQQRVMMMGGVHRDDIT